jgi:hypothetical protein
MSDFSLMDAIECGIVKLPRVPVAENIPGDERARESTLSSTTCLPSAEVVPVAGY